MNDHERARELMFAERVEGLASDDRGWLEAHLESCPACFSSAATLAEALRGLHFAPVTAPAALVARTQARVAERAAELRREAAALLPLRIVAALAIAISVVSTPVAWKFLSWVGATLAAPTVVALAAFVVLWIAPAIACAVLLVAVGSHRRLWISTGS